MTGSVETRIAFYLPSFERGGVERLVVNLSSELLDRGISVDLLSSVADEPMLAQLPDAVNVVQFGVHPLIHSLANRLLPKHVAEASVTLAEYVRYLRRATPDLLVSMQMSPFAILGSVLASTDTVVAVRESNTPSAATTKPPHLVGRLAPRVKRHTYPRADWVIAVSSDAADDIAQFLGLARERITVIYNPTFNDQLLVKAQQPLDHPWFEAEVPVVVSVGRFSDQKDFETLLLAVDHAGTSPRLILVGDGENREQLESMAERIGIDQQVDFVGYQDNPFPYMAHADLFVLSSHYEGLPNVVIEALGVGTPVVATDCPSGPREILLDGEGGRLVPVGDVDRMAEAIDRSLVDTEETAARLERARDSLDRFTPERAAKAYLDLIDK